MGGAKKTILKVSLNSDLRENASLFDAEALVSALFLNLHIQSVQVLICRTPQSPLPNHTLQEGVVCHRAHTVVEEK